MLLFRQEDGQVEKRKDEPGPQVQTVIVEKVGFYTTGKFILDESGSGGNSPTALLTIPVQEGWWGGSECETGTVFSAPLAQTDDALHAAPQTSNILSVLD